MNNIILEFFEQYKHLDELCKQILSSDRGITEYIEEMDHERQGDIRIAGWERDYRQLKKMRWIRISLFMIPIHFIKIWSVQKILNG